MENRELDVEKVIELAKETLVKKDSIPPHLFGYPPDRSEAIYVALDFSDDESKFKSLIMGGLMFGTWAVPEFYFVSEAYLHRVPADGRDPYPGLDPSEVPLDDRIEALLVLRVRMGEKTEAKPFSVEIKREGRNRENIRFLETKGLDEVSSFGGRISKTLVAAYEAGWAAAETNRERGF